MCLLFETIKIEEGNILFPSFHEQRMMKSIKSLFGESKTFDLVKKIVMPQHFKKGIVKCKVFYNSNIDNIEFSLYYSGKINTLRIIHDNNIEYNFKYTDRTTLDKLLSFKGGCDDIIIIKNGMVSDASFANLAFFDGRKWYTPSTPLLPGTRRQRMLEAGELIEDDIRVSDIHLYKGVKLINAMRGLEDSEMVSAGNIFP